jgi:hypothetical protein
MKRFKILTIVSVVCMAGVLVITIINGEPAGKSRIPICIPAVFVIVSGLLTLLKKPN